MSCEVNSYLSNERTKALDSLIKLNTIKVYLSDCKDVDRLTLDLLVGSLSCRDTAFVRLYPVAVYLNNLELYFKVIRRRSR